MGAQLIGVKVSFLYQRMILNYERWILLNNFEEGGESVHLSDEEMHPRPQNSRKWTRQEDVEGYIDIEILQYIFFTIK